MRFVVGSFVLAGLLAAAAPVQAQVESREGIALQNEIYQLRGELRNFEAQVGRGGGGYSQPSAEPAPSAPSNDLMTQLLTRVEKLEEQVRTLRGRVDELQNQVQQQNRDVNKRIDDLQFQINPQAAQLAGQAAPGGAAGGAAGAASGAGTSGVGAAGLGAGGPGTRPGGQTPTNLLPPGAPRAGLTPPPAAQAPLPRTPAQAMEDGNQAYARHDYVRAEADARVVLSAKASPRAYDAQFLLAQSLAGQHKYAEAAVAFDDAYNRSRTGSHAQAARLGLASSLTSINEKKAACEVLAQMHTEFRLIQKGIQEGMAYTARRAGCH